METVTDDQSEVIAFLGKPGTYGLPSGTQVERCETHASIVFLAGQHAYKLKRAVLYPYLDYSTIDRRKTMCDAELAINRRTAPKLYLEVRPIVRSAHGQLKLGVSDGAIVDWVLVMRRFAQSHLLGEMRRKGTLNRQILRALAESVAGFHAQAEATPQFGGAAGIERVLEENEQILRGVIGRPFDRGCIEQLCRSSQDRLLHLRKLLERRRLSGRVRRCHGDLHLNNICLIDGEPTPFDAIEFNDDFACIDVLYDLAFLLMDLGRCGLREQANTVFNRYLERSGDYGGLAALPLFLSCRAAIRAHVTIANAAAKCDAQALHRTALGYLLQAISYLTVQTPRLIAIGGVSGTGKSTLAYNLAPFLGLSPGAVVLRSDVIRKRLMGVDELARLPPEAYETNVTKRVYGEMAEQAAQLLESGFSVVADAVHGGKDERTRIEQTAKDTNASFLGFWLESSAAPLEARLSGRTKDASDATIAVLRQQLSGVSIPQDWTRLDASRSPAEVLASARSRLKWSAAQVSSQP